MPVRPKIATITGTFLTPCVSRNERLYTVDNIGKAVARMSAGISDGHPLPLTMETGHPKAGGAEDIRRIVGRIVNVGQREDGSAWFQANVPDTGAGRDLVALTAGDKPYLSSVSIRGAWVGDVRTEVADDREVETADDLMVSAVDWTSSPGVTGARIERVDLFESVTLDAAPLSEVFEGDIVVSPEDGVATLEDTPAEEAEDTTPVVESVATPVAPVVASQAATAAAASHLCETCGPVDAARLITRGGTSANEHGETMPDITPPVETTETAPVVETVTPVAEATTAPAKVMHVTEDDFVRIARDAAIEAVRIVRAETPAPAAPAVESAPVTIPAPVATPAKVEAPAPVSESTADLSSLKETMRAEVLADLVAVLRESGVAIPRKGVVPATTERKLSEMSFAEMRSHEADVWDAAVHPEVRLRPSA